ncbi:terminase B [Exiguobacterium sp. A1_3_1]|uniref:terminase B n=1 Tax=Exiguobacterium sp. A1_3_1 TaxID=2651871 RepID=UPI003B87125C
MKQTKPYNVLASVIDVYWDDPAAFAEDILGFYPDEWQRSILDDLSKKNKVSVRSGQGVGKTGLEAVVTLWYLTCRPNPKVIATAPTKDQLFTVLWAEIAKWMEKSELLKRLLKWTKTKIYMIGSEERWFATARTATKPENMQGFHEDYMLFIVDEASGVADPIMEAILGTLTGDENKILMCGNPTRTSGVFFDSHNRDKHLWSTHKVSSLDSPRTSRDTIEMLKQKYNEDSDVYRVRVLGDFPKAEADAYIPLEFTDQAINVTVTPVKYADIHIGIDVARYGDDETVMYARVGNKVVARHTHSKKGTTETTGEAIRFARNTLNRFPQAPRVVFKVDDTGVGGGVTDGIDEWIDTHNMQKFEVHGINNGARADDPDVYDKLGDQLWGNLRDLLETNFRRRMLGEEPTLELLEDDKLVSQLTTRKYRVLSKGVIKVEPKDKMKKRGLASPDRADALALCFYEPEGGKGFSAFERTF